APRDKGPDGTITLVAGRAAGGRLINLEGAAAAGVKMHVRLPNYGAIPEGPPWPGPVTTDDKGRFRLRGVGEGYRVVLEVEDDRFVRQRFSLEVAIGKAGEKPTFTLAPLRALEGKVTQDDTGKPGPNARAVVEAYSTTGKAPGTVEARTNDQGQYRVIPFNGNQLTVRVYPPDGVAYLPRTDQLSWAGAAVKQTL